MRNVTEFLHNILVSNNTYIFVRLHNKYGAVINYVNDNYT